MWINKILVFFHIYFFSLQSPNGNLIMVRQILFPSGEQLLPVHENFWSLIMSMCCQQRNRHIVLLWISGSREESPIVYVQSFQCIETRIQILTWTFFLEVSNCLFTAGEVKKLPSNRLVFTRVQCCTGFDKFDRSWCHAHSYCLWRGKRFFFISFQIYIYCQGFVL